MRFIVTSKSLLKNLQQIGGIIANNAVLSITEDFLFELHGNTLAIEATDLESMMRIEMDVSEATGKGSICIPAKVLMEHLKGLTEQSISFIINCKDLTIEMTSTTGKYKMLGEDHANYPKAPDANDATMLTIPSGVLHDGIVKTLFCVGSDTLRPAMTGVLFELATDKITFAATDAHRLVKFSRSDIAPDSADSFVVPKKALNQLRSVLAIDETPIEICYNSSHLFINTGRISMSCRLIDAKFPDYRAVIPNDSAFILTANRADLMTAARRVAVFSNKTTNQVVMSLRDGVIHLLGQDIDFSYEGKETLPCQYNGDDMMIAFNAKLMVEMLANMDGTDINLHISSPTRAVVLRPMEIIDNEDVVMLLMPLQVGA